MRIKEPEKMATEEQGSQKTIQLGKTMIDRDQKDHQRSKYRVTNEQIIHRRKQPEEQNIQRENINREEHDSQKGTR